MMYKILIVEDDVAVSKLLETALTMSEYQLMMAKNGAEALEQAVRSPDIILLDLGLPDMDGVDVIRRVRGWSQMPIIVVSARVDDADKVDALDAGADDYLTKPFSVDELRARLRVALRRIRTEKETETSVYENGDLRIDYIAGCAYCEGKEIHLTPIEYKLLCLLAKNTGRVLSHKTILKEVWGDADAADTPSLRVFMATLRKKIEPKPSQPQYVQTHVGVGYRMLRISKNEEN